MWNLKIIQKMFLTKNIFIHIHVYKVRSHFYAHRGTMFVSGELYYIHSTDQRENNSRHESRKLESTDFAVHRDDDGGRKECGEGTKRRNCRLLRAIIRPTDLLRSIFLAVASSFYVSLSSFTMRAISIADGAFLEAYTIAVTQIGS